MSAIKLWRREPMDLVILPAEPEVGQSGEVPAPVEEDYRGIVENSPQGIVIQQDGRIQYANEACAGLLGYDGPARLVGCDWRVLAAPDEWPAVQDRILARLDDGMPQTCAEWQVVRPDGHRIRIQASARAASWRDHPAVALFLTDVTQRRQLEEQYLHAQKMEPVGRLTGGVAHDFNNLLTVINGYGSLVLASLPSNDPIRELVRGITEAGTRAAALTRQLLAISRKSPLEPRMLDINIVVEETVGMLGRLVGANIELHTNLAPGLSRVLLDPGQLEQVLLNLAVNARDAMPHGGTLSITTANATLAAGARPQVPAGSYVVLGVRDSGCGMDEATRARLFEPFFTTKEPGKGTGLGLATVLGIVKAGGGHIEVESALGRGTTFRIYLPSVSSPAPAVSPSVPQMPRMLRGTGTILLVEDEGGVRALCRHILQSHGYTVLEASNGMEAIGLCEGRNGPIDLLVTDVLMPQLGGRELAARLRGRRPSLKVLYLSGYPDEGMQGWEDESDREDRLLEKPFTPGTLMGAVREVLNGPAPRGKA